MDNKKIVFSGIQPTGQMHLGNYIGAIRQWVKGQSEFFNILCIVDMHAITVYQDPEELRASTRDGIALLLACGVDPEQCLLYVQSHVEAHAELGWILNCITPVGWLQRMTQYKDKAQKQKSVGMGLLDYPVLQAADILLFDTDFVPTGEDQRAHVELTRDIAGRFNHLYGDTFKIPEPMIPDVGAKIMGLDDPTVKMSKSVLKDKPDHGVAILDEPAKIRKNIKRAVTDSGTRIAFSEGSGARGRQQPPDHLPGADGEEPRRRARRLLRRAGLRGLEDRGRRGGGRGDRARPGAVSRDKLAGAVPRRHPLDRRRGSDPTKLAVPRARARAGRLHHQTEIVTGGSGRRRLHRR